MLFRDEVVEKQSQGLYGEVRLDTPLPQKVITYLIALIVLVLVLFLIFGGYARKERAVGWVIPDRGLIRLTSPSKGYVENVLVSLGDKVEEGDPLVVISFEGAADNSGYAIEDLISATLKAQQEINEQIEVTKAQFSQSRDALSQRKIMLAASYSEIKTQISQQLERVDLVDEKYQRFSKAHSEGAISDIDLNQTKEAVLAAKQELASLKIQKINLERETEEANTSLERSPLDERQNLAQLRKLHSDLELQLLEYRRQTGMTLKASVTGTIAALPVRNGQAIQTNGSVVSLIPEGGQLEVEMYIPTNAAGFIEPGQTARLKLDAFSYRKFGVMEGKVESVSTTVFAPNELPVQGITTSAYRSTIKLERQYMLVDGRKFPLQAGMAVEAEIIQEHRKLWEILLDPIRT